MAGAELRWLAVAVLWLSVSAPGVQGLIARPALPPRGWNSYDSFGASNGTETVEVAAAISKSLAPFGYQYVTIDEGWFRESDNSIALDQWGRMIPAKSKYPFANGSFRELATTLRIRNLTLGLWTMFGVPADAVARRLPIRNSTYTADQISLGVNTTCPWAQNLTYAINTTHPGGQAYYASLVELYEEWGIGMVMTLWSFSGSPLIFGGDARTTTEDDIAVLTNTDILDAQKYISNFQLRRLVTEGPVEIWSGDNADPNAGSDAFYIAAFNLGNATVDLDIPFPQIGLGGHKYQLLELWTGLPTAPADRLRQTIRPNSVLAFRATVASADEAV
ncbi:hypothetical protein PTSG_04594 [Salpingoeca rosetta]|uniref:alpha-galactosidase n=1 Tax=Salpingoeca rosetta (strain ATCC 50818 / BSB-021) TaxID=946362 RepID=F2U7W0_SALR5|nr:uncharacterized protein PTSG_04594 [Salpingoeca rosetta]EGD72865.1 hypothetical protein PTSG_04594 [Salpingoeca rosetta]|eukprot:XP_004994688.1 hypothetical protein PTSG_04594 [Salpingoeca rosetta]